MPLTWRGNELKLRTSEAARRAVDHTTAATVAPAKARARRRTGLLQGSIQFRPAVRTPGGWRGEVGSYNVHYAIWQEIGTRFMSGTHYLTRAADEEFPKLSQRIRANMGM